MKIKNIIKVALLTIVGLLTTSCSTLDWEFVTYPEHRCIHACSDCGFCKDPYCYETECSMKCECDTHICDNKCPVCGYCTDTKCKHLPCLTKCSEGLSSLEVLANDIEVSKSEKMTYDKTTEYFSDFDLSHEGVIGYTIKLDSASIVNIKVSVVPTSTDQLFTSKVAMYVNGERQYRNFAIVGAYSTSVDLFGRTTVNLGCFNFLEGENEIIFKALKDGDEAFGFYSATFSSSASMKTIFNKGLTHECENTCTTCNGCLDYACINPGCEDKCTCLTNGEKSHVFCVLDKRVKKTVAGAETFFNNEMNSIGCSWNQTTVITYTIYASEAGRYQFGAVTSSDPLQNLKFTDFYKTTVNGTQVSGNGFMPYSTSRDWTPKYFTLAGTMELEEGENIITLEATPKKVADGGNGAVFNFRSLILFKSNVTLSL